MAEIPETDAATVTPECPKKGIIVSTVSCAVETMPVDWDVYDLVKVIQTGGKKLRHQITQIRNRFETELAITGGDLKAAKLEVDSLKKALPAVTWSGKFEYRASDKLVQHSGLLCADLDSLGAELETVRAKLKTSPHVFALFLSPTGNGLKAVIRVRADASEHPGSFRAVAQHVRELTGVQLDGSCKDVARLCFLSFDPELYHNPDAAELEPLPEPEKPKPAFNSGGEVNLSERQRIAAELLGDIEWTSAMSGLVQCPGKHLHTTGNSNRDCKVDLDGAPTVHCFHNSCSGIIAGVSHELRSRIGKAEFVPAPEDETITRLAALPLVEYDRTRKAEAEKLECRVAILDSLVNAKRLQMRPGDGDNLQGNAVDFLDVAPYETSVNGAQLLDEVAATFSRYLVLPVGAADTLALWVTLTHCFEAFEHVARVNCCSPDKSCGKTTTLDVTACFVARPLRAENVTTAVLFRLVEKYKPTLLLDEVDTYLNENEELRGCLNAGHKRGGKVYRCEGQDNTVRSFAVFAPAALAGIGALPGTLHDRSVVIKLSRAKAGELAARFDSRRLHYETELCRKLSRWSNDNLGELKNCDPQLPETAFNRLADNWRPLFAIAQVVGGDWPQRAHAAFVALTASADLDAQGVGTLLLSDIAGIFTAESTDRLPSSKLAELLVAIEGRPWAEWGKHRKAISTNQLANQLRRFGISPRVVRVGDETARGYLLEDFREAFSRYLPEGVFTDRNNVTTLGETPFPGCNTHGTVLHPENEPLQRECYGVTPQNPPEPGKGDKKGESDAETDIIDEEGVARL